MQHLWINAMSDEKPDFTTEEIISSVKEIIQSIKNKKYFRALKKSASVFRSGYEEYIKGKTLNIAGRQIPRVAVFAVALALGYLAVPNSSDHAEQIENKASTEELTQQNENVYDEENVKVYGLYKCENAVCGIIDNSNDKDLARILISITFHDKHGAVVYEGGAEAAGVTALSRSKFKIKSDKEFEYFHLNDVTVEYE